MNWRERIPESACEVLDCLSDCEISGQTNLHAVSYSRLCTHILRKKKEAWRAYLGRNSNVHFGVCCFVS